MAEQKIQISRDEEISVFAAQMRPLFEAHGLPTDEIREFSKSFLETMQEFLEPKIKSQIIEVHNAAIDAALEAFVGHASFAEAYRRVKGLKTTVQDVFDE